MKSALTSFPDNFSRGNSANLKFTRFIDLQFQTEAEAEAAARQQQQLSSKSADGDDDGATFHPILSTQIGTTTAATKTICKIKNGASAGDVKND